MILCNVAVPRLITRENYAEKIDPSIAPWPLNERNINGNERLRKVIDPVEEIIQLPDLEVERRTDMILVPSALRPEVDEIPDEELAVKLVLDAWHLVKCPVGTKEREIALDVQQKLGYTFINEWLIIQAFTRKSYKESWKREQEKNKLYDNWVNDYEVLELIGDSLISTALYKLQVKQFGIYNHWNLGSKHYMFKIVSTEGRMTREKEKFSDKTYLAECCKLFGFDRYIRAGEGDNISGAGPKEDVIEALVGAVAIDSNWDMDIITKVVENLLEPQFEGDMFSVEDDFEAVNHWHQKRFGSKATFHTYPYSFRLFIDLLKKKRAIFTDYDNDNHFREDIEDVGDREDTGDKQDTENTWTGYLATVEIKDVGLFAGKGNTKSEARSNAAESVKLRLIEDGLWWDVRDCGFEPKLEDAINQLQELYQKKYISSKPEYDFAKSDIKNRGLLWICQVTIGDDIYTDFMSAWTKTEAKKRAALCALIEIFKGSGLYDEKWDEELDNTAPEYEDPMDGKKKDLHLFLDVVAEIYGRLNTRQIAEIWNSVTGMNVEYYRICIDRNYAHAYSFVCDNITKTGIDNRTANRIIKAQEKYGLRILTKAEYDVYLLCGYVRTPGSEKLVSALREECLDPDTAVNQVWHGINQGATQEEVRYFLESRNITITEQVLAAVDQMYDETMIMELGGHSRKE